MIVWSIQITMFRNNEMFRYKERNGNMAYINEIFEKAMEVKAENQGNR